MSVDLCAVECDGEVARGLLKQVLTMNKITKTHKLKLTTETVRTLDHKQLGVVAGGGENTVGGPYQTKVTACWVCQLQ
jgi:hypothetical protein